MTESRRPKEFETHIGNHKLDPSTLMMGHGFDPALSEGSLKPPIFLTSTFVFEKAEDGKRFFEGITNKFGSGGKAEGLVYSRFNGPNQEILEDRLKIWEDAEAALTFSSGMTAIATLLLAFVRPGDGYVYAYGTPNGRQGAAYLARVPEQDILDLSKYEYWNGSSAFQVSKTSLTFFWSQLSLCAVRSMWNW